MAAHIGRLLSRLVAAGGLVVLVAVAIVVLSLAVPKRDGVNGCIYRVPLGLGLTYAHNCDSVHIARDARNLERYLAEPSPSRTRPVHIFSVAVIAHVLSPVLGPLAASLKPLHARSGDLLTFYLAGVVFNVGVLALSFMAMCRLVGAGDDAVTRAALMGLLASYDLMLAWFWILHQIPMNVLAPLGSALAFVAGLRAMHLSVGALVALGLVTSAACLTYGYCLVWPVAFVLGAGYGAQHGARLELWRLVLKLVPYAVAVCAPLLLWLGSFAIAGREAAYEAQSFGQFSWAGAAIRSGAFMAEAGSRASNLVGFVGRYLGIWGVLMLVAAVGLAMWLRMVQPRLRTVGDPVVLGCLVTGVLMLGFNYLQGYHQARLLMFPLMLSQVIILRLLVVAGSASAVAPVAIVITVVQLVRGFWGPATSLE